MLKKVLNKLKNRKSTQVVNMDNTSKTKYILENEIIAFKMKSVLEELDLKYNKVFMVSVVDIKFDMYNKNIEFKSLMPTIAYGEVNVDIENMNIEGDLCVSISAFAENGDKIEEDISLKFKNAKIDLLSNKITVKPDSII